MCHRDGLHRLRTRLVRRVRPARAAHLVAAAGRRWLLRHGSVLRRDGRQRQDERQDQRRGAALAHGRDCTRTRPLSDSQTKLPRRLDALGRLPGPRLIDIFPITPMTRGVSCVAGPRGDCPGTNVLPSRAAALAPPPHPLSSRAIGPTARVSRRLALASTRLATRRRSHDHDPAKGHLPGSHCRGYVPVIDRVGDPGSGHSAQCRVQSGDRAAGDPRHWPFRAVDGAPGDHEPDRLHHPDTSSSRLAATPVGTATSARWC